MVLTSKLLIFDFILLNAFKEDLIGDFNGDFKEDFNGDFNGEFNEFNDLFKVLFNNLTGDFNELFFFDLLRFELELVIEFLKRSIYYNKIIFLKKYKNIYLYYLG
jgi:hypothetical protein